MKKTGLIFLFGLCMVSIFGATAIGRFDVVPYQTISENFEVGVVAFHKNGINRVEFQVSDGINSLQYTSSEMVKNPRTNVEEFWFTLNSALFMDGEITVTARIIPVTGIIEEERDLSLCLFVQNNPQPVHQVFVSPLSGDDANPGTRTEPFFSIREALYSLKDRNAGEVILLDEAEYNLDVFSKHRLPQQNEPWITIRSDEGLDRDRVQITLAERAMIRMSSIRIKWEYLSFNLSRITEFYDGIHWFNDCRFYNPDGWTAVYDQQPHQFRGEPFDYYATNSIIEETLYGFTYAEMVRNCYMKRISGDALQGTVFLLNSVVDTIDGTLLAHHTDLYQLFGEYENVILYNFDALNLTSCQSFFLESTYFSTPGEPQYNITNAAFVNCSIYNTPTDYKDDPNFGGPPYSQMISNLDHILFINLKLPGQQIMFRTDLGEGHNQMWNASDVFFINAEFHYRTYSHYVNPDDPQFEGWPSGVTFMNATGAAVDYSEPPAGWIPGQDFGLQLPPVVPYIEPPESVNENRPKGLRFIF